MSSDNNKRIAKNTLFLYFRMMLIMAVSLYTSRVILNTLGVEDFGIYNVVGGIIVMFSFLSNALAGATQRFLTFELGKNNINGFQNIFSLSILSYVALAGIIIILAETVGLWFLNHKMVIPHDRIIAANWVFHFSILAFSLNILRTPYHAALIAHEKMSFYAFVSIIEVLLKLAIVYILVVIDVDKLKLYSILTACIGGVIYIAYYFYCKYSFKECTYQYFWDKDMFIKITSFSGWSMFGQLSVITTTQGVNILMNMFFGVIINASMGIANQVSNAVNQFVSNFQIAFNPQITKYYAENEYDKLFTLVFQTAKFSYFLLFVLSLPILLETQTILNLWLKTPPEYSVYFTQLIIISLLIDTISGPLWMLAQATGEIRKYQLIISSFFFINLIGTYIAYKIGFDVISALYIRIVVCILLLIARLQLFINMVNFPSNRFIKEVLFRIVIVSILSIGLLISIQFLFTGISKFIITICLSIVFSSFLIYILGLNKTEQSFIKNFIRNRL